MKGRKVLINGAGGGVGALALQFAKAHGAHVTAVDGTSKLSMLRSLGADEVIDYTREGFTRRGVRYDLIFDVPVRLERPSVT
jgi:NADPH:quinone reductase-like Zn-dependent oxidoreductase